MQRLSRAKFTFFSLFVVFFMSGCSFLTSPSGGITASGGTKKSGKMSSSKGMHAATMEKPIILRSSRSATELAVLLAGMVRIFTAKRRQAVRLTICTL